MKPIIDAIAILVQAQYRACCDDYMFDGSIITGGRIVNDELFSKFERISDYLFSQLINH